MQILDKKIGHILVVKPLEKRIDASVATDFKDQMAAWVKAGNKWIILDLAEVDFIDSLGLGAIISSFKTVRINEGNLVICGPKETVMKLFQLTRMDRVLQIFVSLAGAVNSLKG